MYGKFLGDMWTAPVGAAPMPGPVGAEPMEPSGLDSQKLALEKDMQRFLRRAVDMLEPGLTVIDDVGASGRFCPDLSTSWPVMRTAQQLLSN